MFVFETVAGCRGKPYTRQPRASLSPLLLSRSLTHTFWPSGLLAQISSPPPPTKKTHKPQPPITSEICFLYTSCCQISSFLSTFHDPPLTFSHFASYSYSMHLHCILFLKVQSFYHPTSLFSIQILLLVPQSAFPSPYIPF